MFRAEMYDPDHWADVFERSGAKYVALTSKHHEGFTLWRSAEANKVWNRPWNAVDIGPKRDVLLELMEAGRRKGLHMGIYYSLYEWYNPLWLSDRKRYVAEHLFPQFKDVVTHAKPSIIFSDGEWDMTSDEWRSPELLAWLFNESPVRDEVVIDDRWGKDTRHKHGGYYTTEYTSGMQAASHPWEESRGMGYSYGYNRAETLTDYHTDRELLMMLIDIVSRGGNLLLDIGPTADGRIPVVMEERLTQIGDWLKPNGEAIYGTHAWRHSRQWSAGNASEIRGEGVHGGVQHQQHGGYSAQRLRAGGGVSDGEERRGVRHRSATSGERSRYRRCGSARRRASDAARRRPGAGKHHGGQAVADPHSRCVLRKSAGPPSLYVQTGRSALS